MYSGKSDDEFRLCLPVECNLELCRPALFR